MMVLGPVRIWFIAAGCVRVPMVRGLYVGVAWQRGLDGWDLVALDEVSVWQVLMGVRCVEWIGCSVTDLKEAALCVEELKAFKYHAEMVYTWVSESLEKKDRERDLLVKLLLHLHKLEPPLLSRDQLEKGYGFITVRSFAEFSLLYSWVNRMHGGEGAVWCGVVNGDGVSIRGGRC